MRQKTKQLICSTLVRSGELAERMARIMSEKDIELLVNGIIVDAKIKEGKLTEVCDKISTSKSFKITKVTGYGSIVRVYYKIFNDDDTEELEEENRVFDLNINPNYEELFDLQVI